MCSDRTEDAFALSIFACDFRCDFRFPIDGNEQIVINAQMYEYLYLNIRSLSIRSQLSKEENRT